MFADWKEETSHVKKSFGALGKQYPKMLQAYQALGAAAAEGNVLDAKTRELIALAVAVQLVAKAALVYTQKKLWKAGASEAEVAAALAMSIALNAGAAYTYSLRALEAYNVQKG